MQGAHPLMQGCKLPKRESAMVGLIPDDAAEEDPEVNEDVCILVCKTLSLKQIHALEIRLM